MFRKWLSLLTVSLALGVGFAAVAQEAPDALVRKNVNEILAALKADKDIAAGDLKKVEKLAEEKILSEAQKKSLIEEFRILLVRTYSTSISQFRNQSIEVKPAKVAPSDTDAVVKTLIIQPGGQPIPIDYSVEKSADTWKVFDVLIDGVSLVTNYRSSFNAEIQKNGIDGLIKSLSERNAKNAAKK
jgi:phospholipid transport system substrate-binding protein